MVWVNSQRCVMAKQVHLRLDDGLFETLSEYTGRAGLSVNDFVTSVIMQSLSTQIQSSEKRHHIYLY